MYKNKAMLGSMFSEWMCQICSEDGHSSQKNTLSAFYTNPHRSLPTQRELKCS
ncbi:hypothetical protein ALT717_40098 [Alteromonas macleodii]